LIALKHKVVGDVGKEYNVALKLPQPVALAGLFCTLQVGGTNNNKLTVLL
jgi:hypothetical protein